MMPNVDARVRDRRTVVVHVQEREHECHWDAGPAFGDVPSEYRRVVVMVERIRTRGSSGMSVQLVVVALDAELEAVVVLVVDAGFARRTELVVEPPHAATSPVRAAPPMRPRTPLK
jgi:hypothetical protein